MTNFASKDSLVLATMLTEPLLPTGPDVWKQPPEPVLQAMMEKDSHGLLTRKALKARENWARAHRWMLVKPDPEMFRKSTLSPQGYLTLNGVPRPINGTDQLMAVYQHIVGKSGGSTQLAIDMWERTFLYGELVAISDEDAARLLSEIRARRRGGPMAGKQQTQRVRIQRAPRGGIRLHKGGDLYKVGDTLEMTVEQRDWFEKQGVRFQTLRKDVSDDKPTESA